MMRTSLLLGAVFAVSTCLGVIGCTRTVPPTRVAGGLTNNAPSFCEDEETLIKFCAADSLSGQVQKHIVNDFVAVQTFPFSGLDASRMYVYLRDGGGLTFLAYVLIPTQRAADVRGVGTDAVEIWADGKLIDEIERPS
jgi:hypothetical protein